MATHRRGHCGSLAVTILIGVSITACNEPSPVVVAPATTPDVVVAETPEPETPEPETTPLETNVPPRETSDQAAGESASMIELDTEPSAPMEPEEEEPAGPEEPTQPESDLESSVAVRPDSRGDSAAPDVTDPASLESESESAEPMTAESVPPPPVRLFLPTTTGTLLVDLDIRIADKPLADAFAERIDRVIIEAGGDDSSECTWEQLFTHVSSDPQQFGQSQPLNDTQYKDMIRRYDTNRNRRPDPKEVAKFLFRSSLFAGPFRLSGTDHYRQVNRSRSVLFQAIDSDGNGLLEEDELDGAARSLMRIDENADQGINLSEAVVASTETMMQMNRNNDPAWNRRRTHRRGTVAMDLEGYIDWTILSYSLDAKRSNSPFGIQDHAIDALDKNNNESISGEEAKALRELPPDLTLSVQFDGSASSGPTIEIVSMRPELDSLVVDQEEKSSISLLGQSLCLSLHVVDVGRTQNRIPREAFDMLDANSDGVLDENEIPAAAAEELSIETLDVDDDGKLTYREINAAMPGVLPIWGVQVRGRAAEFPDAVFAWLDSDQDQFLSEREILAAGKRLRQGRSGPLKATDIPDSFVVQLVRGDPGQDSQSFRFTASDRGSTNSLPRWASEMDINGDGDISRQEFIGTAQQFSDLDQNQDGFIGPKEVTVASN